MCAVVVMSGCGGQELVDAVSETEVSSVESELSTYTPSFVVARRDRRKCGAPMCGGYFIRDVNRRFSSEYYVSGLDFSTSQLLGEHRDDAQNAGDFEVILYGKLGPAKRGFRSFVVKTAWRGMPGVQFDASADSFYQVEMNGIRCITTPCPTLSATRLNSSASARIFGNIEVGKAALPYVDQDWLMDRVVQRNAVVAGHFVQRGNELTLEATQVFVRLPDFTQSCGRPSLPFCPGETVNVWARNENRCLVPAGCGGGGACALFVPECAPGYSLVSWTAAPFACTVYACDPTFLLD